MKILFLGYIANPKTLNNYSNLSIAGQNYQVNFIESLIENEPTLNLEVISIAPMAAYPISKLLYKSKDIFHLESGISIFEVPFINIPIFKQLHQVIRIYLELRHRLLEHPDTKIITFNLFPQTGLPLLWLSRIFKVSVTAILADLPINDNPNLKGLSLWLRKRFDKLTNKAIQTFSQFIILNPEVETMYTPLKKNLLIPGGIKCKSTLTSKSKTIDKHIVYTGALTDYSGIMILINAMEILNSNTYSLDIYGSGYLEKEIQILTQKNPKIVYHGVLSHEQILRIQKEAWLLVNPRPIHDPIARYTFPSKIFEYMQSSTPVLSTKLNGFSHDLLNKMFITEDDSAQGIAQKINEIDKYSTEELRQFGIEAKDYIEDIYLWRNLGLKILKFLLEN